ncbi:prefoldin subunit alpha [Candidatus Marsarchaeota archaeon]|jgi:prefoldin alpha subunit|nr:prefoldin subunit alpha [Candidatus Marsarchaeota archaeon]MCL5090268.1 prefoldin subunit alpha [Candidatus Marsarchaeota archaeon]
MEHKEEYTMEELQYMLQVYQDRYRALSEEIKETAAFVDAMRNAEKALENLESLENKNALINVGGGLYLNAKVEKLQSVAVEIGAGLIVEKGKEEAAESLKGKIEKHTELMNKMLSETKQIEETIYNLSIQMRKTEE